MGKPRRSSDQYPTASALWDVETKRLDEHTIRTEIKGRAHAALAKRVEDELIRNLSAATPRDWILDATGIETHDQTFSEPFSKTLKDFRAMNGRHLVAIVPSGMFRAMFGMISIGAKQHALEVYIVENMPAARRTLEQLRRSKMEGT